MKRLQLFVATLLLVALTNACTQNIEGVDTSLGYTTITVGLPESRTSLGAKDDNGIYAIYWSEGDQIVVNGAASTRMDIGENRKSATFHFEGSLLKPPFYLTYPYTANSACAEGKPTVVFAAEQEYVEGSFGVGYAPMCGYIESGEASMQHLAGVLQFTVKGTNKLSTIEIIAEEGKALAGEFDVNCESGTLTAINGEVSNKITYTANQTLTEDGTAFHITVPKGIEGVCKVVLTDSAGQKMNLKWTASNVSAGVVREFKPFTFKGGASFELQEMTSIEDDIEADNNGEYHDGVWGYIKYDDGTPAVGVSVSDGFSVVQTDENGFYQFAEGVDDRTYYIYYSIPADAKVVVNDKNYHTFFKRYLPTQRFYNFKLTKITKESNFSLFVIADTHGYTDGTVTRLKNECIAGVQREVAAKSGTPCYAIICGDIVCTSTTSNSREWLQATKFMPLMREAFAPKNTGGVPTFYVMGNHDHERTHFDNASTNYSDYNLFNYHAQDAFEQNFAPANYSFNRGDTHIVCMRDILWPTKSHTGNTSAGEHGDFTDEQLAWLTADLENVTTDKKVVLCVHIPLSNLYNNASYPNVKKVVDLLKDYTEPQIFSGHTHTNRDVKANSTNFSYNCPVSEKTIVGNWGIGAAVTDNGFSLKCEGDGAPFGFDVYDVSGAAFTNHYYVDCTSNLSHNVNMDYVMRAYLSCDTYGGDSDDENGVYQKDGHADHERYFRFPYPDSTTKPYYVHVNVFNGSPDTWTLKLYVNNVNVGTMAWVKTSNKNAWINPSPLPDEEKDAEGNVIKTIDPFTWSTTYGHGSGTEGDPWISTPGNSQDWWFISYIINETSATSTQTTNNYCHHKWHLSITEAQKNAIQAGNFRIEATHTEFDETRTYTTSKIFGQADYNGYINYK